MMVFHSGAAVCVSVSGKTVDTGGKSVRSDDLLGSALPRIVLWPSSGPQPALTHHVPLLTCYSTSPITMMPDSQSGKPR